MLPEMRKIIPKKELKKLEKIFGIKKKAIIKIAPISSKIAKEVRNILILVGTLDPNKDNIPSAKAMSVAMGIPHPSMFEESRLKAI